MRPGRSFAPLAILCLLAAGCGGAVRSDLLADDPGFGDLRDASAGDSGDPAPAADAGVALPDATATVDAGSGGGDLDAGRADGGPLGDGGRLDGGAADAGRTDGGVIVVDAGAGNVDAGAGRVRCGPPANGLSCDANAQTCCAAGADDGRATFTCELSGDCGGNDVPIECASSADCTGGKVCCGYLQSSSWYSVECVSNCGSSGGFTALRMCVPGAPNACPFGRSCVASQRLVGYGYCN